ncbi:Hit family protein 1 [Ceratocystis lukuohia]|uniref:Hit family protein 1 n=1 Tax=Ceratocystis lukuohia TaxID=2019550 RepID=A0ABR4MQA0_9PEZI
MPTSRGHALVIPKHHGAKLADIPDDQLSEILNNGTIAHQQVDHVHFHMIPKPTAEEGLVVGWPSQPTDMERLKVLYEEVKAKM